MRNVLLSLVFLSASAVFAETNDALFIHHSVGENWLNDGLDAALVAKTYIDERNDITYGTVLSPDAGRPASLGGTPGDLTDMEAWILWFNDYLGRIKSHGCANGFNRIILFKSCYPNSDIGSDGTEPGDPFSSERTIANHKAVYRHPSGAGNTYNNGGTIYRPLEDIFAAHPEILFIPVTAPALCYGCTTDANGHRARAFNNWLKNTWLPAYNTAHPGINNVAVFDLFDVLAYADNHATHPNRLRGEYGGSTGDSHPNSTGNAAATAAFATTTTSLLDIAWAAFAAATPPNPAPAVVLTSPTNAWSIDEPADVAITASATDPDGITSVRFYAESVLIGVATSAPYAVVWSNVPAGLFPLTARARDALGATATSPTVWVRVLHTNAVIAGDYDGDALPDLAAVWRAEGNWYIARSVSADTWAFNWGWNETLPAPGDFDGDGICDPVVFWPANGTWYILQSRSHSIRAQNWGWADTLPIAADFDGDQITDFGAYWPAAGNWYILLASGRTIVENWGWSETVPVPEDYDGDGACDLGAYHPASGNWYVRSLLSGTLALGSNWGWSAAAPTPGDYDGDGRADFAVFHRETGNWYVRRLTGLTLLSGVNWGWGETPAIPCDFDGDAVADMAIYFPATAQWFVRKLNGDVLSPGRNWGWSDTEPGLRQYQLNRMLNPGEW
ncbi:MAG TPA: Ig-like domain-containing protein [Kiritimatiellia bacterium]|nr:Ig-like domain-containing protein [Kiritimatiellia bacterium]